MYQDIRIPHSILIQLADKIKANPKLTEMRFETITGQVLKVVRQTGRYADEYRARYPGLKEYWDAWDFIWNPED